MQEFKKFSQNGEDGIIHFLHSKLPRRNYRFVEVGCADGMECNSRFLLESGWSGVGIDADQRKIERFKKMEFDQATLIAERVTLKTIPRLYEKFPESPDFFSLDIDSFDYFIADWLFRNGFRPKIICVETNTFLRGCVTVEYKLPFSRYGIQPAYGLYFGASEEAWKHLFKGYKCCGFDSSYTNCFFIDADYELDPIPPGFQTFFCRKYGKTGEELADTLTGYKFLDVRSEEYEMAYESGCNDLH
jgi:hypothetical protein